MSSTQHSAQELSYPKIVLHVRTLARIHNLRNNVRSWCCPKPWKHFLQVSPHKNCTCPLCCMNLHSGRMHGEIFPNSRMTSGNYLTGGNLKTSISLRRTMYSRMRPRINLVTMCRHFTQAYKSRIWPGLTSSETSFSTYLVSGIRFALFAVHTDLSSMLVPWIQQWLVSIFPVDVKTCS